MCPCWAVVWAPLSSQMFWEFFCSFSQDGGRRRPWFCLLLWCQTDLNSSPFCHQHKRSLSPSCRSLLKRVLSEFGDREVQPGKVNRSECVVTGCYQPTSHLVATIGPSQQHYVLSVPELCVVFTSCVLRTHTASFVQTNQCSEMNAVCSQIVTKQVNILCGQNIEVFQILIPIIHTRKVTPGI
jgi:hypothetical protein